jgi:hypothetical protein
LYQFGGIALAVGAIHLAVASGIFGRLESNLPSHKFLRAAYGWLLISGLLMVVEPVHLGWTGQQFSHAYVGGIRHAVTVGFISQMIIGVGTHVAARMNDARPPVLLLTFVLLNLGNLGRVALEIATDYTPRAFAPMGFTGFIELTGLALWAAAMIRLMFPRLVALRRLGPANAS